MNLHLALRDDSDGCRPVPTDAGLLGLRIKHLKPNETRFTVSSAFIYIQTPVYTAEKKKIRHVFLLRQLLGFVLVRGNPTALLPQFYAHTHTHTRQLLLSSTSGGLKKKKTYEKQLVNITGLDCRRQRRATSVTEDRDKYGDVELNGVGGLLTM